MNPLFVTHDSQELRQRRRGTCPSARKTRDFCARKLGPLCGAQITTHDRRTTCEPPAKNTIDKIQKSPSPGSFCYRTLSRDSQNDATQRDLRPITTNHGPPPNNLAPWQETWPLRRILEDFTKRTKEHDLASWSLVLGYWSFRYQWRISAAARDNFQEPQPENRRTSSKASRNG